MGAHLDCSTGAGAGALDAGVGDGIGTDAGVGDGIGTGTGKLLGGAPLASTAKTKHERNCSGDSPVTSAHDP